jgi:hypothetical protein
MQLQLILFASRISEWIFLGFQPTCLISAAPRKCEVENFWNFSHCTSTSPPAVSTRHTRHSPPSASLPHRPVLASLAALTPLHAPPQSPNPKPPAVAIATAWNWSRSSFTLKARIPRPVSPSEVVRPVRLRSQKRIGDQP